MKLIKMLALAISGFAFLHANAQDNSKEIKNGKVVLTDGSVVTGTIKDKIHSNASVVLITGDNKKKNYDGSDLLSAEVGNQQFLCLKGDFFKIIYDGDLKFLQKASDASRKPIYNGNEAIFANGTEGKPGDYFIYDKEKKLRLLTRKTIKTVVPELFADCKEAIDSAKSAGDDVAKLGNAVVIYNNHKQQ